MRYDEFKVYKQYLHMLATYSPPHHFSQTHNVDSEIPVVVQIHTLLTKTFLFGFRMLKQQFIRLFRVNPIVIRLDNNRNTT